MGRGDGLGGGGERVAHARARPHSPSSCVVMPKPRPQNRSKLSWWKLLWPPKSDLSELPPYAARARGGGRGEGRGGVSGGWASVRARGWRRVRTRVLAGRHKHVVVRVVEGGAVVLQSGGSVRGDGAWVGAV